MSRITFSETEIRRYYESRIGKLHTSGKELRGPCPIHKGHRDSMAINLETGTWYCHSTCARGGSIFEFEAELSGVNGKAARDAVLAAVGRSVEPERRIVATYDYLNENGGLLFQTVRFQPKDFSQRRPNGNSGLIWNLRDVRRVLYRLPAVIAAPIVFVVEGEKDADALTQLGVTATTAPLGAGKWRAECREFLRAKEVFIIPDNDDKGRQHAADVMRSLAGVAASAKLVTLPFGKDATEWIEHGGTLEELISLCESAEASPPFDESDVNEWCAAHGIEAHGPQPYHSGNRMWLFRCPLCGHPQACVLEANDGSRRYRCDGCGESSWTAFQARVEGKGSGAKTSFDEQSSGATASTDEWPDPIPLRPWAVPAIQAKWIPGALGDMAVAVATATETPLELAVLMAIPVVSGAIAGKVEVEVETGYIEPTNLYTASALESGARKTAVVNEMVRPLIEYESDERRRLGPVIKRVES
jgi:hypothetical protein